MAEAHGLVRECINLAAEAADACFVGETPDTDIRGLGSMFLCRAAQSLGSAGLLADNGFVGDAMSCGRTVVEMAIDFTYIAMEPEPRLKRFAEYEVVHESKMAHNVQKYGGNLSPEYLGKLRELHVKYNEVNGDDHNWAGCSIKKRAKQSGQEELYELSFAEQCNASHSGPGTLAYTIVKVDGVSKVKFGNMPPDSHPMILAHTAMCELISQVAKACDLDPSLGDRATVLSNRVRSLSELAAPR